MRTRDQILAACARAEAADREATPGPWTLHEDGPGHERRRVIWGAPGSGRWPDAPTLPLEIAAAQTFGGPRAGEVEANWQAMADARTDWPAIAADCREFVDALAAAELARDEAEHAAQAAHVERDRLRGEIEDARAEIARLTREGGGSL